MTDHVLVAKNLDGMKVGTRLHAGLVAAEIGSTLAPLRRSIGLGALRALVRRGVLQFEPPLPPARASRRRPRPALGHGLASGDDRFRPSTGSFLA